VLPGFAAATYRQLLRGHTHLLAHDATCSVCRQIRYDWCCVLLLLPAVAAAVVVVLNLKVEL
jgi:hypothetical protein